MITVALIGVLASIAGSNYIESVKKARIARTIAELQSIALILDSYKSDDGALPESLAGIADQMVDIWGNEFQYLKIEGNLAVGLASNGAPDPPHVSAAAGQSGSGGSGAGSGSGAGGSIMGSVRKDRFLVPINSDYDLYSVGADDKTRPQLQDKVSRDDIIRASDGAYFGRAANF